MEGSDGSGTKASFFARGEELQGFLEVLDGRADVLVLQGAARVLAVLLGLGELLRGEMDTAWREGGVTGGGGEDKRYEFMKQSRGNVLQLIRHSVKLTHGSDPTGILQEHDSVHFNKPD